MYKKDLCNSHNLFISTECLRDAETHLSVCIGPHTEERRRGRAALRLQAALVAAQEIGDEKLQVVQILQDLIDNKQRSLDADHKKLCKFFFICRLLMCMRMKRIIFGLISLSRFSVNFYSVYKVIDSIFIHFFSMTVLIIAFINKSSSS